MIATIGERLELLRDAYGISQEEIAKDLGIPRSTYRNWENGIRDIKASDLIRLADYFDISADYLLGRAGMAHELSEIIKPLKTRVEHLEKLNEKTTKLLMEVGELLNG